MPDRQLPHIPSGIELRRLLAFVALIEFGGLQPAAEALHLTKEGVAKPIRELRRSFRGQALTTVDSDGRHRPTVLGEELYVAAIQMLYIAEGMGRIGSSFGAHLTLGYLECHSNFMVRVLSGTNSRSSSDLHGVVLTDQRENSTSDGGIGAAALARGVCDVLIAHGMEGDFENVISTRPLYRASLLALVPAEGRAAGVAAAAVAEQRLLLPTPTTRQGLYVRRALAAAMKDPRQDLDVVVEAQTPTALVTHALAGIGTAVVPADVVAYVMTGRNQNAVAGSSADMAWVPLIDAGGEHLSITTHLAVRRGTSGDGRIIEAAGKIVRAARTEFASTPFVSVLGTPTAAGPVNE